MYNVVSEASLVSRRSSEEKIRALLHRFITENTRFTLHEEHFTREECRQMNA